MTAARANGTTIEYEVSGPAGGAPLLLILGFGQQLPDWPAPFVKGFTRAGFRVIVFDNRDAGLSQKWDGRMPDFEAISAARAAGRKPEVPYSLGDMAADAAGLLDALGIENAHVLGASMGGMIAQLMALEHTAKCRSLITLFSTTGDGDLPPSTREAHMALLAPPSAQDRASVVAHVVQSHRAYASKGFEIDDTLMAEHAGRDFDRMYYPEGGLRQWAAVVSSPPRGERLKSLNLPALVLHGKDDPLIPCVHGRRIADCIPGAEYDEIAGWGHDIPPGAVPLLLSSIVPFIKLVEKRRRQAVRAQTAKPRS